MQPEIIEKDQNQGTEDPIKVLYVDDEPMLLDLAKIFLERHGGIQVETAISANIAIDKLKEEKYQVIVSDYQMPDMNGIEFLKYIHPIFQNIPFILFTGRGREEIVIEAINNGATFYLQKGGDPKVQFVELTHKILQAVRKQRFEEEVIKSRNRFESYFNLPLIGIFIMSPEGSWLELNAKACTILGYSAEELVGQTLRDLAPPEDRDEEKNMLSRILSGEIPSWTHTKRFVRKDGVVIDADLSLMPVRNINDEIEYFVGTIQDVTEKKRMEREIAESQQRFKELADLLPLIVFEADKKGYFTFANKKAMTTFGYSEEELRDGLHYTRMVIAEERDKAMEKGKEITNEGESHLGNEYTFVRKDGSTFPGHIYTSPIIREGRINGFRGILVDLTDIRREEDKFSKAFYNNPALMAISNLETGILVDFNRSFEEHTGYYRDEILGKRSIDLGLINPVDIENVRKAARSGDNAREFEIQIHPKQGEVRTLLISGDILEINDVKYLITHAIDITERIAVERALHESEDLIRRMINAMPDIVCFKDGDGRWINANNFMLKLFKLEDVPYRGLTDKELATFSPFYKEVFFNCINSDEATWKAKTMFRGVEAVPLPDGSEIYFDIIKVPSFHDDGSRAGIVLIGRDITENQRMLEDLEETEILLKTVYEQNPAPMILVTIPDMVVRIMNPACIDHLGISREMYHPGIEISHIIASFQMYNSEGVLIPDDESPIAKVMKGIRTKPQETKIVRADGTERWNIVSGTPIFDHEGNLIAGLVVFPDITHHKKTEEALAQANKKLNLLSSMTRHDTLNSLVALIGYLDLLSDPPEEMATKELIQRCTSVTHKIRNQIAFTKDYQDMGVKAARWQRPEEIIERKQNLLDTKGIQVKTNLKGLTVFADPLFEQVIYNLLENALRYGETITGISSSYQFDPDGLVWIFEDDGVGVPDDMKEKIFEKNIGKNSGLGLFLAREILEITNITIHENGIPGKGARFEMHIPYGKFRFD